MNIISIATLGITGAEVSLSGKTLEISTEKLNKISMFRVRHGNIVSAILNGDEVLLKIERHFLGKMTLSLF